MNTMPKYKLLMVCILFFTGSMQTNSLAQQRTVNDGVYTTGQVEAGQAAYESNCATCHNVKTYEDMWAGWEGRTVENLWYFLIAEMPADNPGSLLDEEYTNIVAIILSEMGFPAGDTPLTPNNGMDQILLVAPQ